MIQLTYYTPRPPLARLLKNRHEAPRPLPLCVTAGRTNGRGVLAAPPGELGA